MLTKESRSETDKYQIILVRSGSRKVWVESTHGVLSLPRIELPKWRRSAEQLQKAIEASWGLRAIILDFLGTQSSTRIAVVQIESSAPNLGLDAINLDEVAEDTLTKENRIAVEAILSGHTHGRGPFSRVGWISDATEWLRTEVGNDVSFTKDIRQYNAGGSFALVRFATQSGPAYWMKATGEPNAHEFRITAKIAGLCPEHLPPQIAVRQDWNAWLMEDAGQPIRAAELPALEHGVRAMAGLQVHTLHRTGEFLEAGAFDQRSGSLRMHLEELTEYLDNVMIKQTSTEVPRLDRCCLLKLESVLRAACWRMEELEIPDTLVHFDVNPGNILFNGNRCVFTDWCECGVCNPFLGLEYLLLLLPREKTDWHSKLREEYRRSWCNHLSSAQFEPAFRLAPLLAMLAHLYGRGTWLKTPKRNRPQVEGYARSLARYMDRASRDSQLLRAL